MRICQGDSMEELQVAQGLMFLGNNDCGYFLYSPSSSLINTCLCLSQVLWFLLATTNSRFG